MPNALPFDELPRLAKGPHPRTLGHRPFTLTDGPFRADAIGRPIRVNSPITPSPNLCARQGPKPAGAAAADGGLIQNFLPERLKSCKITVFLDI